MATELAVTTLGAHPFSTGPDQCLVHNGSLSNHNNIRRDLVHDGMSFETENDTEVAAAYLTWRMNQGLNLGEALKKSLDDLDGFFTFVVGTKNGFGVLRDPIACKPAVMAETDQVRRLRLGIPRARQPPRHRQGPRLGARARNRLFLGTLNQCAGSISPKRAFARSTRTCTVRPTAPMTPTWEIVNPRGLHAVAAGVDAPLAIDIRGSVGYYCAGMNKKATITVHGSAGPGVAENMMSGKVVIKGDASQYAGATGRGGLLVIEGNAASRCGISMKGIDIVVRGNIGHMSAFMAQSGHLVVLGDAGDALGDSIYEAQLFVRGAVKSLGADCIEKDMRPEHHETLAKLLERAGVSGVATKEFRRYGSARKLYTFNIDNADAY